MEFGFNSAAFDRGSEVALNLALLCVLQGSRQPVATDGVFR